MKSASSDFRPTTRFGLLTGRGVLIGLLSAFAVVFTANGLLIYNALSTFDGIEVADAYQKGRAYNHVLEAMEVQKQLGWSAAVEIDDKGSAHDVRLRVAFTDRAGQPLRGLTPHGVFYRPVVGGLDQRLAMKEVSPGRYEAEFHLAEGGNWIARVAAEGPHGEKFAQEQRVTIRD